MIGALVGAGASLLGGALGRRSAKKQQAAAERAQRESELRQQEFAKWANQANIDNARTSQGMTRENWDWANALNRGNQEWGQGLNQTALDRQTASNRLGSTNAFGGTTSFGDDGTVTQKLGAGDQASMDAIYGKLPGMLSGMGEQFGVNNDVMNALRGQLQPGFDQYSAAQRARAAAMGVGFGSGQASDLMENQIGRDFNDMNQKAVLGGQQAWLQGQNLINSQIGAMNDVRQGIQSGTAQPDYWKQGSYAGVQAPSVQGWSQNIANVNAPSVGNPMDPLQAGQVAGAGTQQGWNQLGTAVGKLPWDKIGLSGNTANPTIDTSAFSKTFQPGDVM